ncbi:ceramide kinase-like [Argonauta hians]
MEPSSPLTASNSSADLRDVFHIKNVGYDVTLSRANNSISWTPMSLNPEDGSSRQKSTFFTAVFKRTKLSSVDSLSNDGCVEFKNVYGARIIHRRTKDQGEGQGICMGISILTYEEQSGNKLLEKNFMFSNPCRELCNKWVEEMENILEGLPDRPKNLRVLCQPYAGNKQGVTVYGSNVEPIFKNANTNVDFSELGNTNEEELQELIEDMDLTKYDCLVVVGGDGTVNKVVNCLMDKYNSSVCPADWLSSNVIPTKPTIKIGIIPTGTTNHIAQSVIGTCDPVTAAIHITLGHYRHVDLCSVHHDRLLYKWVFNSQYGFAGNVLTFAERYRSVLRSKKMEGGFLKALTQSKLRSYMCKVEYIQIDEDNEEEKSVCTRGCTVCGVPEQSEESSLQGTQQTYVESAISSEWKVGPPQYFMNIGIFTIPGLCSFAPEGLSMFTHLSDGSMHLSLVHNTERSEFLHFLKRHTTSKDQFDLPFVSCYKVRQVRITPYPQITEDKDKDQTSPVPPLQSDTSVTKDDSVKGSDSGDSSSTSASRKGSTNKKKKKTKADSRSLSIWNVDNEANPPLELEFRVHHAVLKMCGEGILNSFMEADEPKISCLFT